MTIAVSEAAPARTHVQMSYLEAIVQAQVEEMQRDERVVLMAEDIAIYGDGKIVERFDENRVWGMPISENSFTGVGIGAAITGLRPIVSIGISSFAYLASDQIINQAAKLRFMTGGQIQVPIVFRLSMYYGRSIAAQHSDRPYPMFMNIPGLKVLCASSPADMKGLLKSAIRDDDPVVFFEDARLWPVKGEVPVDPEVLVPIGKARIVRPGTDVTILAIAGAMRPTLEAADALAADGISAEIIDPRSLKPLDMDTVIASVQKTGRLIIVENAHRMANAGAEIAANLCEDAFDVLRRPIRRLCAPDIHVAFSPVLENALFPGKQQIVDAAKSLI